jgi:hypothetical protein
MLKFLFYLWSYKYVFQEAENWKEEVIDFQNPYAYEEKSCNEISFYPLNLLLILLIPVLLFFI